MRHFITIVLLILLPLCAKADNSQLYKQLDAAIEKRAHYVEVKEKSLNDIKQGAKYVTSNEDKLKLYEQLANGYKAYEYDSAMTYVKKALVLAQKSNNTLYHKRFQLSQTSLLITRGFYAEAKEHHAEDRTPRKKIRLTISFNTIIHFTDYTTTGQPIVKTMNSARFTTSRKWNT